MPASRSRISALAGRVRGLGAVSVLRFVREERFHPAVEFARDVDHKRRRHIGIHRGINHVERPPGRRLQDPACAVPPENTRQSAIPACVVVIRMARFPIGKNDGPRLQSSDLDRELLTVLDPVDRAWCRGNRILLRWDSFRIAAAASASSMRVSGVAAAAHLAGREIDDARPISRFGHAEQSAAAGLLHIVRMRRDGQQIYHWRSRR